jgi:hypothetical protein
MRSQSTPCRARNHKSTSSDLFEIGEPFDPFELVSTDFECHNGLSRLTSRGPFNDAGHFDCGEKRTLLEWGYPKVLNSVSACGILFHSHVVRYLTAYRMSPYVDSASAFWRNGG